MQMFLGMIRPEQGLTLMIWWLCGSLLSHGVGLSHHRCRVGEGSCTGGEGKCKGNLLMLQKVRADKLLELCTCVLETQVHVAIAKYTV